MSDMAAAIDVTRGPGGSDADRRARAARDATALAYLTGRGLDDIAVILGLTPAPPRRRTRQQRPADPSPVKVACESCTTPFTPRTPGQRACSKRCGATLGNRTKAART